MLVVILAQAIALGSPVDWGDVIGEPGSPVAEPHSPTAAPAPSIPLTPTPIAPTASLPTATAAATKTERQSKPPRTRRARQRPLRPKAVGQPELQSEFPSTSH
jgi:hypothetical protein